MPFYFLCMCLFIYRELWMNYLCLLSTDEYAISEKLPKCHLIFTTLWQPPLITSHAILWNLTLKTTMVTIVTRMRIGSARIRSIVTTRTYFLLLSIPTKPLNQTVTRRSRVASAQISTALRWSCPALGIMLLQPRRFTGHFFSRTI